MKSIDRQPEPPRSFAIFQTAIGFCGVVWSDIGIAGLLLPEADAARLRVRLERRATTREANPPRAVAETMGLITSLTSGAPVDLLPVVLDMNGVPEFHRRVYDEARLIRPGQTATYGDIARRLQAPGSARAVGQALGRNPFAIIVPCHRVLAANGRMGGFTAPGGIATKQRLLEIEGARRSLLTPQPLL